MKVDDVLASTEVLDLQGHPVALGSLWAERPAEL